MPSVDPSHEDALLGWPAFVGPVVCALPADMRPIGDVDRALVLAPKRSYTESIDPRLYCFGAKATEVLAAGTKIVAHLGWWKSHGTSAPFVVSSLLLRPPTSQ